MSKFLVACLVVLVSGFVLAETTPISPGQPAASVVGTDGKVYVPRIKEVPKVQVGQGEVVHIDEKCTNHNVSFWKAEYVCVWSSAVKGGEASVEALPGGLSSELMWRIESVGALLGMLMVVFVATIVGTKTALVRFVIIVGGFVAALGATMAALATARGDITPAGAFAIGFAIMSALIATGMFAFFNEPKRATLHRIAALAYVVLMSVSLYLVQ